MQVLTQTVQGILAELGIGLDDRDLQLSEGPELLGSPYSVTEAAVIATAAATAAVAAFDGARRSVPRDVAAVDARHAAAAFASERLLAVPDLEHPANPLPARNYLAHDGWVRLHTNLAAHRRAVLAVLDVTADRLAVERAVRGWSAEDLEDAVIEAGGTAAAMRTRQQWQSHPQRHAIRTLPLIGLQPTGSVRGDRQSVSGRRLDGIRVLDLTRVIAGPVAGRFLAAFGADVLHVDAPHLDDDLLLEIDTGFGKRRTEVDLRHRDGRRAFDALLQEVDVVLDGFRPGALVGLGYDDETFERHQPGLVRGRLSAYGNVGPWGGRRGFDSVVQVATGIAHTCGFTDDEGPAALPVQALDHASGYLLATGIVAGLLQQLEDGRGRHVEVSLLRTAEWLSDLGTESGTPSRAIAANDVQDLLEWNEESPWGPIRHVRPVGRIGDRPAAWPRGPAPRSSYAVG